MKGKTRRWAMALTLALSMVFSAGLGGCAVIDKALSPSVIEDGFSEEWLTTLRWEYNLAIPESAVYEKGFYEPGQDFSVHMLFTVNADELDTMAGAGWRRGAAGYSFGDEWYTDLTDARLAHYYVYSKQYTVLFFSDPGEDGRITCAFVGWRP